MERKCPFRPFSKGSFPAVLAKPESPKWWNSKSFIVSPTGSAGVKRSPPETNALFKGCGAFRGGFAKRMAPKPPEDVNITQNARFKHFPKKKW